MSAMSQHITAHRIPSHTRAPSTVGAQPGRSWGKGEIWEQRGNVAETARCQPARPHHTSTKAKPPMHRKFPITPIAHPKCHPYAASPATLPTASLDNPPRCIVSAANFAGTHTPISRGANAKPSRLHTTPCTPPTRAYQLVASIECWLVLGMGWREGGAGEIDRYERGEGDISLWVLLCARTTRAVGLIACLLAPSSPLADTAPYDALRAG